MSELATAIVGYTGRLDAGAYLVGGLRRLEYARRDRAGVAVVGGRGLQVAAADGELPLESALERVCVRGGTGVGFMHWSAHGEPASAAPRLSCYRDVAVVLHGTIDNLGELEPHAGEFDPSMPDDQALARFVAHALDDHLELGDALAEVARAARGAYALLVVAESRADALFAISHGVPLAIGRGQAGAFVASDLPALPRELDELRVLDDGDVAVVRPCGVQMIDCLMPRIHAHAAPAEAPVARPGIDTLVSLLGAEF